MSTFITRDKCREMMENQTLDTTGRASLLKQTGFTPEELRAIHGALGEIYPKEWGKSII